MLIRRLALTALVLAACCAAAAGQLLPGARFVTGPHPDGGAAGDVDGDGRPDLVLGSSSGEDIFVLRSLANGFAAPEPVHVPAGSDFPSVAVADLDGDGLAELATVSFYTHELFVYPNLGDGTFGSPASWTTSANPRKVMALDADGDGHTDVLASAYNGNFLTLLHGDGAGAFPTVSSLLVPPYPWDFEAADLDHDGALDLVVSSSPVVSVLLGDGAGGFLAAQSTSVPYTADSLEILDANEDGDVDLATMGWVATYTNILEIWPGDGSLVYGHASVKWLPGFQQANSLLATDADGDGRTDLLAIAWVFDGDYWPAAHHLVVWRAQPGGFADGVAWPAGGRPSSVVAADFDADGYGDLAVPSAFLDELTLLRGLATGGVGLLQAAHAVADTADVAAGDLDQDGHLDVVTIGAGGVQVFHGDGRGVPQLHQHIGTEGSDVRLGDVDGDGLADAVITTLQLGVSNLIAYPGLGDATLGAPIPQLLALPGHMLALAPFDADANLDAVVASADGLQVLVGQGDGHFAAQPVVALPQVLKGMAAGDTDGDGLTDVVITRSKPEVKLTVMVGDGAGGFASQTDIYGTCGAPLVLGDLDHDGALDIVTAVGLNALVYVNNGRGGVQAPLAWPLGHASVALGLADLDGNGDIDLYSTDENLIVALGDGSGGLLLPQGYAAIAFTVEDGYPGWNQAVEAVAGDFDEDGRMDVACGLQGWGMSERYLVLLPNASLDGPWLDLQHGLPGAQGTPALDAAGSLQPGTGVTLHLHGAAASAPIVLVVGVSAIFQPFKGGVLVPAPERLFAGLATDANGELTLEADMPEASLPGASLVVQAWVADAGGPAGFAASHGLAGQTP